MSTAAPPAPKGPKPLDEMTLTEIAAEITRNLKRLEEEQNKRRASEKDTSVNGVRYYHAGAWVAGSKVGIQHISYQGRVPYSRKIAECYLSLLRAGEAPHFGDPRFHAIEVEERKAKEEKKRAREQAELDARRAGLSPDGVYAVRIPAQVVYVVGRPETGAYRLREAAYGGIFLHDPVPVGPEAIPEEDLNRLPIVPRNYLLKDPALEGKPLGEWPR